MLSLQTSSACCILKFCLPVFSFLNTSCFVIILPPPAPSPFFSRKKADCTTGMEGTVPHDLGRLCAGTVVSVLLEMSQPWVSFASASERVSVLQMCICNQKHGDMLPQNDHPYPKCQRSSQTTPPCLSGSDYVPGPRLGAGGMWYGALDQQGCRG